VELTEDKNIGKEIWDAAAEDKNNKEQVMQDNAEVKSGEMV
jgi:hypothetical protein